MRARSWFLRAHQHGHGDDETRLVAEREVPFADSELPAHRAAALRIDDLRLAELVGHHADIADPDAIREARAERFDDRFLRGEPHSEEAHGPFRLREQGKLFVEQQAARKMLAEPLPRLLD